MVRRALICEADLKRMARVVRKEGVAMRVKIETDGGISLTFGIDAKADSGQRNGFDEALG
jgi:hypothetical protein